MQEFLKFLHGMDWLCGRGLVFDGVAHNSYTVTYERHPDCPWHEDRPDIVSLPATSEAPLADLLAEAQRLLGKVDALDFSRELIATVRCPGCGKVREVFRPLELMSEADIICPGCQMECSPEPLHSIPAGSPLLAKSAREIGLPAWDMVFARGGARVIGLELAGDSHLYEESEDA